MRVSATPPGGGLKLFGSTCLVLPSLRAACSLMCFIYHLLIIYVVKDIVIEQPPSPLLSNTHRSWGSPLVNATDEPPFHQFSPSPVGAFEPRCAVATHILRYVFPPYDSTYETTVSPSCPSTIANYLQHQSSKGKEASTSLEITEILLCWPPVLSSKGSRATNPNPAAIIAPYRYSPFGSSVSTSPRYKAPHHVSPLFQFLCLMSEADHLVTDTPKRLIQVLSESLGEGNGVRTPLPMDDSGRSTTEDEANPITSKPPEEDSIDHHFIPTYLRVHGSHLTATQVASVALTLFTIGISSESDLHDVDAQLLADICRDDKSLSHLDHARTRQFLTHRGSPHFPQLILGPSFIERGLSSTSVPISVPAERRGRKSGVVLPADFGSDRPTVLGGATPSSSTGRHRHSLSSLAEVPGDHGVPAAHYHGTEPVLRARTRHSQSFRYLGGTSARQH